MSNEKTVGEKRVRTDFNVQQGESYDIVHGLKTKSAELINMIDAIKNKDPRLAALAQTAYEEGALWAVKLATV